MSPTQYDAIVIGAGQSGGPLSTDLAEVRRRVTGLTEFDDTTTCDDAKLDAIRAAWNEEFLDRTQ